MEVLEGAFKGRGALLFLRLVTASLVTSLVQSLPWMVSLVIYEWMIPKEAVCYRRRDQA